MPSTNICFNRESSPPVHQPDCCTYLSYSQRCFTIGWRIDLIFSSNFQNIFNVQNQTRYIFFSFFFFEKFINTNFKNTITIKFRIIPTLLIDVFVLLLLIINFTPYRIKTIPTFCPSTNKKKNRRMKVIFIITLTYNCTMYWNS